MAKLLPNRFTQYELTTQEQLNGEILSPLNKLVVQNQMAMFALEQGNLIVPNDVAGEIAIREFATRHAELSGKVAAMQFLLDLSERAEEALVALNRPSSSE